MRPWIILLGGLIVWAIHFFVLFGIASILLTTLTARILTLLATVLCLGMIGVLAAHLQRCRLADETTGWGREVARTGVGLSAIAVIWQALPALLA